MSKFEYFLLLAAVLAVLDVVSPNVPRWAKLATLFIYFVVVCFIYWLIGIIPA